MIFSQKTSAKMKGKEKKKDDEPDEAVFGVADALSREERENLEQLKTAIHAYVFLSLFRIYFHSPFFPPPCVLFLSYIFSDNCILLWLTRDLILL